MNFVIANKFKELIANLPFADVLAGLTKIHKVEIPNEGGQPFMEMYPIECSTTIEQCRNGDYIDLSPDSNKKSVMYFEDLGIQFVDKNVKEIVYQSRLRLIGWLNLRHFVNGGCSMSAQVIANIFTVLPFSQPINVAGDINLTKLRVISALELPKNADIFLRYSYKEEKTQFLMYPFDFFAIELTTEFTLPFSCIPDIEMTDPAC